MFSIIVAVGFIVIAVCLWKWNQPMSFYRTWKLRRGKSRGRSRSHSRSVRGDALEMTEVNVNNELLEEEDWQTPGMVENAQVGAASALSAPTTSIFST